MISNRDLAVDIFQISTGSTEPIYRQMVEQVRRQILGGQLLAGDAMPSVREVATALGINPMTVSKAYSLLEADDWLVRRRGMGMVVAEKTLSLDEASSRLALLRPSLERVGTEAKQLQLPAEAVLSCLSEILNQNDHDTNTQK
ncbi:GntR family transcriptional regulator [Undibacterium fentianense]|uniref:GntR family transcriptional regulator n=1 Tax=Undibacterium fentianense TaxID=2828728 RepID=A0A941E751_9BURK|nr:GntR family transcriptional regulator [Undibacterium fentianense]MBR7799943.1 GntR family transcriptional regulator [Undibacterium fentianense]